MEIQLKCPNRKFPKTVLELTLVEIHDFEDDHEVGGQDLPYKVTVKVEGVSLERALESDIFESLDPFTIRASNRLDLDGHLEFYTFSGRKEIQRFFGIVPDKTAAEIAFETYFRSLYVRTVGELRSAIADLPDDFPLLHTGTYGNALGMHLQTGSWQFQRPGSGYGSEQWGLRLGRFDIGDWEKLVAGTWQNRSAAGFDCSDQDLESRLDVLAAIAKREINAMCDQAKARIEAMS